MKPGDIWPAVECECQICGETFLMGRISMNERIWDFGKKFCCPECETPPQTEARDEEGT